MISEAKALILAKFIENYNGKDVRRITFSQKNNQVVGQRTITEEQYNMIEANKMYTFTLEEKSGSNGTYTKIVSIAEVK